MDHAREAAIRARAYQLWIESGYADGQQDKHWRQAEREIAEKDKASEAAPVEPAVPQSTGRAADAGGHSDGTSHHPSIFGTGSGGR